MLLLACALALLGAAQGDLPTAVEGKVLDSATKQPVPGARVILARLDRPGLGIGPGLYDTKPSASEPDPKADRIAVLTGDDGVFRFSVLAPAKFALYVDAPGYVRTPTGISQESMYTLKPGIPIADISLRLTHEVGISGRVINAETERPVPSMGVRANRYHPTGSGRMLIPSGGSATTDENGRFKLERMEPGDYYLEVQHPMRRKIDRPAPEEDFRHAVRKTYASVWYPGVERIEEAMPVRVAEGIVVQDLELKASKRRTAAIRGRVLGDATGEAHLMLTKVNKQINSVGYEGIAQGTVNIGSEFEIDRLAPGVYYLLADLPDRTGSERRWAILPLEIGEENKEGLDPYLRPAIPIRGRVRIADREVRPDEPALEVDNLRIGLWRMLGMGIQGDAGPALVNSKDGAFSFEGVIADRYLIYFSKAGQGYKVAEVRYNQTMQPHGIFTVDPATEQQFLDITLAPASASVLATATGGSRPSAGATVLLVPDSVTDEAIEPRAALREGRADGDGHATITGLLPGKYRLTAYSKGELWGDDPNLKARLRAGTEVRVTANQTALIEVRTAPVR